MGLKVFCTNRRETGEKEIEKIYIVQLKRRGGRGVGSADEEPVKNLTLTQVSSLQEWQLIGETNNKDKTAFSK